MNAMEKVAWTEVTVSGLAIVCAAAAYPWLGDAASAAFGILGFVFVAVFFVRKKGNEVVTDERDKMIEKTATSRAVHFSWMITIAVLAVLTISFGVQDMDIPRRFVVWLVWGQFALLYLLKGLSALLVYRGDRHAAQG